jgi:hypothetical protein
MSPVSSAEVLIAKVKSTYGLSNGQLAEILNVSRGTICVAATGRRSLPAPKLDLLRSLLATAPTPRRVTKKTVFPGYVMELLKKELIQLVSKRGKSALQLFQMEQDYDRFRASRDQFNMQHDALSEAKVPIRVLRTLKRHALIQDVRIDRVDQHHIVKLRAVMAGLDAQIALIQSALLQKSL